MIIPNEKRLISIDIIRARCVDDEVKERGHGCSFSGWIREAIDTKLKTDKGFSYTIKKRRLMNELAKQD